MLKIPILDLSNFEIIQPIGEGQHENVFLVEDVHTKKKYAAKVSKLDCSTTTQQIAFFEEIRVYSKVKNPAILSLYGFNLVNFEQKHFPTIIRDYMSNDSLDKLLEKERQVQSPPEFNPTTKYIILLGTALGMKYLHSQGIIHKDLKPYNILLDENYYPKIYNFGLSRLSEEQFSNILNESKSGSPIYLAPEIISGESYSYKADVYSFSYILYELLSGKLPIIECDDFSHIDEDIKNGKRPDLSIIQDPGIQELLTLCWSNNSSERPTFDEIVQIILQERFQQNFGNID